MKFEVTELEVGKKVHWLCRLSPHDWEGSTVTWDLTPTATGTKLLFGHRNLTVGATGYSIEETRAGWEYFLPSLKSYLETGKGTPYVLIHIGSAPFEAYSGKITSTDIKHGRDPILSRPGFIPLGAPNPRRTR